MICEREMSSAGGGKQLKKVMTDWIPKNGCSYRKRAPLNGRPTEKWNEKWLWWRWP